MDEVTLAERQRLLDEGNRAKLAAEARDAAGDHAAALPLWRQVHAVADRYREWLPEVPVARCPSSGHLVKWPIDTVDLDGWFWNSDAPARRLPRVPATWLAMTGAMRLVEPITYAAFTCLPGPGAPFVVPRILDQPGVVAVLSQITVGAHTGWPVTYFGPLPAHRELENLWGERQHPVVDDQGEYRGWKETTPWPPHYDYDLAPWLDTDKLLWIAPGDDHATLRRGADDCPYLGLAGDHGIAFVAKGTVRYWRPPPEGTHQDRFRLAEPAPSTTSAPPVDHPGRRGRILTYLRGGARLPEGYRTDGEWIWSEQLHEDLERDGVAPPPDLAERIAERGYHCPPVTQAMVEAAQAALARLRPEP